MTINPDNKSILPALNAQDNEVINALRQAGCLMTVKKGETVLNEGEPCRFVFFVEDGCFRAFRNIDGRETTIGFSFSGDIDTSPYSFINDVAGNDTIVALKDSRIIKVNRSEFDKIAALYPSTVLLTTKLLSHNIEILIRRITDLKCENAHNRYLRLYERQPAEVSEIPLKYIASYLGITAERLSRIRNQLKFNKDLTP